MSNYVKDAALKVNYIALKKTSGLTDVTMKVYTPAGALFSTAVMTEILAGSGEDPLGLYTSSFIPDVVGQWRVRISSVVNGDDISKIFEVYLKNTDDLSAELALVDDKVDIIDGNVDLIKIETDKIPLIKTETDKIQTIDDNVDAIKVKTDNLPVDTAAVLQAIKDVVDQINLETDDGGYIL